MKPLVLSPDDLNADWVKVVPDKDGRPYRESELELHDQLSLTMREKHLPGRHDQKKHDPTKGAGRPVPADATNFTGTLYHNTSLDAVGHIEREGLKPGQATMGQAFPGVFFMREPKEAGIAREAMVSVDVKDAKLAPTVDKFMELQSEIRDGLLERSRSLKGAERSAMRERAYSDGPTIEARNQFTELGYDGYEQGWDVVIITNPDMLKVVKRVKHLPLPQFVQDLLKTLRGKSVD